VVVQEGTLYVTLTQMLEWLFFSVGLIAFVLLIILILRISKVVKQAKAAFDKIDKIGKQIEETIDDVRPAVEKCKNSLLNVNSWVTNIGSIALSLYEWGKTKFSGG